MVKKCSSSSVSCPDNLIDIIDRRALGNNNRHAVPIGYIPTNPRLSTKDKQGIMAHYPNQ